jgi:hypothetical protein
VFKLGWAGSAAFYSPAVLARLNANPDLGPPADRQALHAGNEPPADGLFVGYGWYALENFGGQSFRWVSNDAELVVWSPSGSRQQLRLELEPGPGLGGQPMALHVLDEQGQAVASAAVQGRQSVDVTLPLTASQTAVYRLHVDGGGLPTPTDPRTLNFRVFAFGWAEP